MELIYIQAIIPYPKLHGGKDTVSFVSLNPLAPVT